MGLSNVSVDSSIYIYIHCVIIDQSKNIKILKKKKKKKWIEIVFKYKICIDIVLKLN